MYEQFRKSYVSNKFLSTRRLHKTYHNEIVEFFNWRVTEFLIDVLIIGFVYIKGTACLG
jgi:hypothetical protein